MVLLRPGIFVLLFASFMATRARAIDPMSAVERTRGEVTREVQLYFQELIDELSYQWAKRPPLEQPTPTVIMGVQVPGGFNSKLSTLLEDHITELLIRNPQTHIRPVHCQPCTAVVTHIDQGVMTVGRGSQILPIQELSKNLNARHALYLNFEEEGTQLVLRARLVELSETLPIIAAKSLSVNTGLPPMLRDKTKLKSADEAREEYLNLLKGRPNYNFIAQAVFVTYFGPHKKRKDQESIPPMPWLKVGIESASNAERVWLGGISYGHSKIPELLEAWYLAGKVAYLLNADLQSFARPDFYLFMEAGHMQIKGLAAIPFIRKKDLNVLLDPPRTIQNFVRTGVEMKLRETWSFGIFAESLTGHVGMKHLESKLEAFHGYGFNLGFIF